MGQVGFSHRQGNGCGESRNFRVHYYLCTFWKKASEDLTMIAFVFKGQESAFLTLRREIAIAVLDNILKV